MSDGSTIGRLAVVGGGRMGRALIAGLPSAAGPFGRGFDGSAFDVVLLAVPDDQIVHAAAALVQGPIVGHCAGSLGLDALAPHEAFGMHPLMTATRGSSTFAGAGAAVAGTTPRALGIARELAEALGMTPFQIADADRAAYHAAASIASNFLVTLEDAAELMLATAGVDRSMLVPLVRATLENWAALGAPEALTGPIVRGDEATVARQRAAVAERAPQLLALFDVMCRRTRDIAAGTG
ncbi:MAG: hypothetical protein JWN99_874 [Ilumatobacteraceae bacterium]|nr:hypothetical protein [Ilumatobacteraceae bacterium]